MGNATMKGYWPPPGMVTIVLVGGRIEQYNRPVSAGDIMLRHPQHHVVRPDFFRSSPVNVLKPEEVLTPGQKFFLVPFRTVAKKLRRREDSHHRSSSHSSTCRGSVKDCTKASIGVGKKGATRIPAGRLTVLRKSSPSPARSTRQARKTLLQKEMLSSRRLPSIEDKRRTTLRSHMRKKSADSEAAFEPPPDVTELDMFHSEDYMECISFESSVVLAKPVRSSVWSVPEFDSFQSSAKSSMESLLTSVEEQETFESPGMSKLEKLIFKDFLPAKIFNPNGGTSGSGGTVEKQPEQSSKGYALPKPPQPPSDGCASVADHIPQVVDTPKAARSASDKCVSFDGKMQNGVDSYKATRPVLDNCNSSNGLIQKVVDSPSEQLLALSGLASSDAPLEKRVHSSKPERPFVYGIASADYIMPKRVVSARSSQSHSRFQHIVAAHPQPTSTKSGIPDALGQRQQPPSREKNLVSHLRETERPFIPTLRSEPQQQQREGSEEQVGYLRETLFDAAPGYEPGKCTIEVKSHNSGSMLKSSVHRPPVHSKPMVMDRQAAVTNLVKKHTPAPGNKLINHLCFAPQQGSETPMLAAALGDTQEKQSREQRLKLSDHLKRDQNSPPNQQNIPKHSPATSVNLQIQTQCIFPIPNSGSTRSGKAAKAEKELVAFQLSQAVKTATLQCNNSNKALTTTIQEKILKLPPTKLLRPRRIRTRSRLYSAAHWKPRLSPLVEFSPTHSELSVKS